MLLCRGTWHGSHWAGEGGCSDPRCKQPHGHERATHGGSAFPRPGPPRPVAPSCPQAALPPGPSPGGPLRKQAAQRRSLGKSWACALCKAFPRYINDSRRNAPRSAVRSAGQHGGTEPPPGFGAAASHWAAPGAGAGTLEAALPAELPSLPSRSGPRFMQCWRQMKAEERGLFSPCTERVWKQCVLATAGAGARCPYSSREEKGRVCSPGSIAPRLL